MKNLFNNRVGMVKKISVLFFFLTLFSAYPYIFPLFLPIPNFKIVFFIALIILSVFFIWKRQVNFLPKEFWIVFFFQSFFWIFLFLYHSDSSYLTRIFFSGLSILFIQFLNTQVGLPNFIKLYNNWIMIMIIGGTITFFLVLLFKVTPIFEYINVDGRPGYFFGLSGTNVYMGGGQFIRYSGFLDESGAIANWGIFALLFNKLFIRNKKFELVVLIGLVFTFSLAFYFQAIVYLFLFYGREIKKITVVFLILCFSIFILYNTIEQGSTLYRLTFQRFEYDASSGSIEGNSRSELTQKAKKVFLKNPILGNGASKNAKTDYLADNPYEVLANDGIIGSLFMYLPVLILFFYSWKNKELFFSLIILSLGYLQRPYHIDLIHPTMLYSFYAMFLLNMKGIYIKRNED